MIVNIRNKENQEKFPMEASYSQLCAAALNSPHEMLLIRHPDRRSAFCWHFRHTHAHTHTHTLKVPYAHLYSEAYTPGLRKSPFTNVSARGQIFYQSMEALTLTQKRTQPGRGVSGEAPNCAALLETRTLFYPHFTCRVLDGWIKPQGASFVAMWVLRSGWIECACAMCVQGNIF